MTPRFRRLLLALAGLVTTTLLAYYGLFGPQPLSGPPLEIQMHNTYFVLGPAHALLLITLLLLVLGGGLYLLLTRLPARVAAWVVGLAALALLGLTGSAVEGIARTAGASSLLPPAAAEQALPGPWLEDGRWARLLTTLKVVQVGLGAAALLAGVRLGRLSR